MEVKRKFLAAAFMACAALASAAPPLAAQVPAPAQNTLVSVLAAAKERVQATDVRVTGRLVQVAADGSRTASPFSMKGHWFADGLHMLLEIHGPAHATTRFLLITDPTGHTSIEVLGADGKSPTRLTPEHWGDTLAGTYFSYEDLAEEQFLWTKQTLLPAAKYGSHDCFVLQSAPGNGERSHYASVTTWLDQKTGAPVHMERVASHGVAKQFVMYDVRQTDGVWAARQTEVKVPGSPGSSLLIFERGTARAHLQRKDFDLAAESQPAKF